MSGPAVRLAGRRVLVAGATSQAGIATVEALVSGGASVIAVGSDAGRLSTAFGHAGSVEQRTCDLSSQAQVLRLAADLRADGLPLDGLFHLVGGWRGGSGIAGQSDEDYEFLHRSILTTLRNTTRAFVDEIARSPHGRVAIVSATAVDSPAAAAASYAALKAAAETWIRAVADEFAGTATQPGSGAAASIIVVKALVDDVMRKEHPERRFPGFTHVSDLAQALTGLFSQDPVAVNGRRIHVAP